MTDTQHVDDGITLTEAWLIFAADVLDVTHTVLQRLSPAAQAEITTILTEIAPHYIDHATLTERVETALDNLDYE
ncbi:MAG: hypothetical protein EPN48_15490 [Microbacteriaceae bacterium]|nr:MAG: hypothetical protein EPN48_15490 [Microbacteriaceae bacterium]